MVDLDKEDRRLCVQPSLAYLPSLFDGLVQQAARRPDIRHVCNDALMLSILGLAGSKGPVELSLVRLRLFLLLLLLLLPLNDLPCSSSVDMLLGMKVALR